MGLAPPCRNFTRIAGGAWPIIFLAVGHGQRPALLHDASSCAAAGIAETAGLIVRGRPRGHPCPLISRRWEAETGGRLTMPAGPRGEDVVPANVVLDGEDSPIRRASTRCERSAGPCPTARHRPASCGPRKRPLSSRQRPTYASMAGHSGDRHERKCRRG